MAGKKPALGVADEDDLVRAGDCAHGINIGAKLPRGLRERLGSAVPIIRGEDGPAVLAQFIA